MRKPFFFFFCICENKDADQRLCFRYIDSTIPLLTKSEVQATSHLLWLYSPVCVGPGKKPRRPVFSQRGSYYKYKHNLISLASFKYIIIPRFPHFMANYGIPHVIKYFRKLSLKVKMRKNKIPNRRKCNTRIHMINRECSFFSKDYYSATLTEPNIMYTCKR